MIDMYGNKESGTCTSTICPNIHNTYLKSKGRNAAIHIPWLGLRELCRNVITIDFVAIIREQTIPTERPPLFGEVSANVCE
jgi:hypothetical protein